MSLVLITPDLNLSAEEPWLGALTILEQVITQVVERVHEKSTPPGQEFVHTLETGFRNRIQATTSNARDVSHHKI